MSSVLSLGFGTQMGACGSSEGTDTGDGESSETASTGTGESGTTETSSTSTSGDGDGDGDATTGGFVPTDTGDATTSGGTTGAPGPNGSMCNSDAECESEICVDIAGFAGICSECRTDQECMDSGAGLNCSIGANQYFECGSGSQGTMCMSDDACDGELVCAQVVDLGGLFNDSFCSVCKDDAGCMNGELCVPDFDLNAFTGERVCAAEGSLQQDALCDADAQCTSGICGTADIMGFLQLGICSECNADADCAQGQTCTPASADLLGGGGLAGGTCG